MDYRELIEKKQVEINSLPEKVKRRIARFNKTLKAYNINKNEKARETMKTNLEDINDDIVDEILYYLASIENDKKKEEEKKINISGGANAKPNDVNNNEHNKKPNKDDDKEVDDKDDKNKNKKNPFHMFGWQNYIEINIKSRYN